MATNILFVRLVRACNQFGGARSGIATRSLWKLKNHIRQFVSISGVATPIELESSASKQTDKLENETLETWNLIVEPRGRLSMKFPFNVKVEPVNPIEYPHSDRVFINLYATPTTQNVADSYRMNVEHGYCDKDVTVTGGVFDNMEETFGGLMPLTCHVQVPPHLDVDINLTGRGRAEISNVEGTSVSIGSNSGDITLNSVSSMGLAKVCSESGTIEVRKSLVANMELLAGQGDINCDKLQGSHVRCRSDAGNIHIKALYCVSCGIATGGGHVQIGSSHGDVRVRSGSGHVRVDAIDGSFEADVGTGDVNLSLCRHETVRAVTGHGDITLKLTDATSSRFCLSGPRVTLDPGLESLHWSQSTADGLHCLQGETSPDATATVTASSSHGHVQVLLQDWVDSLKLGTHGGWSQ